LSEIKESKKGCKYKEQCRMVEVAVREIPFSGFTMYHPSKARGGKIKNN
jgi:hypothetical protein